MFEPDPAHPVGDRMQEVVPVELARPEQLDCLIDKAAVPGNHLGRRGELLFGVGDGVEEHVVAKVVLAEKLACKYRRVLQHFVANRMVDDC